MDKQVHLEYLADRIEATLDHLAWFTEHATWPGMVPVIQGYTIPERLHCLEERSLAQVAVILDVSEANIHSVKHRAIQRLKEAVARLMKKPAADAREN